MGLDLIPIEIDVYFGMQTDGSAEVSWHTSWWVCTDITFKDLVQKCNNSVMEEYPDTNLLEYTLIINMASGAVVNETNIGADPFFTSMCSNIGEYAFGFDKIINMSI
ncbi:hypothetical protein EYC84_005837 [Monilinia fructicola]|uniref:Uncharacterized protein n=1 Tax=Monilinia fructicola TaxID=38448 RepID=A0A5M9K6D0_MONFR|nr:hypothetical protein EYC84_005837 [Monilinia fructicola]